MIVWLLLLSPLVAGLVSWATPVRRVTVLLAALSPLLILIVGVDLALRTHSSVVRAPGLVRVDALGALMVVLIGTVGLIAGLRCADVLDRSTERNGRVYAGLVQIFLAAMLGAVTTANLGVVWLMIEMTTIATSFLVAHQRNARALEASWKYVVLCSLGIAVALLGLVVIYFASAHAVPGAAPTLDVEKLILLGHHLNAPVLRVGVALALAGFATKVGLAPFHSWLPDAHSQAPAPVSGLMSGVLLSVALYALVRVKSVADAALGPLFARDLLVTLALGSLLVAAVMILATRDLKRLLAYSSIEHLGLATLALAAGSTLALAAAFFHILGHGLVKSSVFLSAGEVSDAEGTTRLENITGLLQRQPALGLRLGVGLLALVGLPPFSLFLSEVLMTRAEFAAGLVVPAVLQVLLVVGIGVATLSAVWPMFFGEGERISSSATRHIGVPGSALVVSVLLGVVGSPVGSFVEHAARAVGR
ncbi:MAG: hydrogenase [Acidimicrobiaceae bacterium]|nr:hydrogenase [Acidimicrobiaceae bacterium]